MSSAFLDLLQPSIESVTRQLLSCDPSLHNQIATSALIRACSNGNASLLDWLLTQQRPCLDLDAAVDEQGTPALIVCLHANRADFVPKLIEAGVNTNLSDLTGGWTALHWTAHNLDLPTASYLLNHGASPTALSYNKLKPAALVKQSAEGDMLRDMLIAAEEASSGIQMNGKTNKGKQAEDHVQKMNLIRESARQLDIDLVTLSLSSFNDQELSLLPTSATHEFDWTSVLPNEMLIVGLEDLPILLDLFISEFPPKRALERRLIPANAVFLASRYSVHYGSTELMDELIFGAIERIEDAVQSDVEDLSTCSFWLCNAVTLVYYFQQDEGSTSQYILHLIDLVKALSCAVIRLIEKRIDAVLDPAILDYEAVPGMDAIKFESDWKVLKAFSLRSKKDSGSNSGTPRQSVMSLFSSPEQSSPIKKSTKHGKNSSLQLNGSPISPSDCEGDLSPKSITAILSASLCVLKLYDIHPLLIAQIYSQVFYWLFCELCNRVLGRKAYLCRSKAMQIRLNISSLEEWAKLNGLSRIIAPHLRPCNQLLLWLQALSGEQTLDGLVGTMQSLTSLNPLQLKKAVKDYRYEVDESHIGEECTQYLEQIEKDWTRQRLAQTVERATDQKSESSNSSSVDYSEILDAPKESQEDVALRQYLDNFLSTGEDFSRLELPFKSNETLGEFLDSRHMLAFALPTSAGQLLSLGNSSTRLAEDLETPMSTPRFQSSEWNCTKPIPLLIATDLVRFDTAKASIRQTSPAHERRLGTDIKLEDGTLSELHDWRKRLKDFELTDGR